MGNPGEAAEAYLGAAGDYEIEGDCAQVCKRVCEATAGVKVILTPLEEGLERLRSAVEPVAGDILISRPGTYLRSLEGAERVEADVLLIERYGVMKELMMDQTLVRIRELLRGARVVIIRGPTDREEVAEGITRGEVQRKKDGALQEKYAITIRSEVEKYVVLYSMVKMKLLSGRVCVVAISPREKKKVELFLHGFGLKTEGPERAPGPEMRVGVCLAESPHYLRYKNVIAFSPEVPPSLESKVVYVGNRKALQRVQALGAGEGVREFGFNFEKASPCRYRVESVLRMITPGVLRGKARMDFRAIKHLRREPGYRLK